MLLHKPHSFHIPVLGIGYSIDTPLKVARFGISSVISIMDDELIEKMRMYHSLKAGLDFTPITNKESDYRAKRITAYLNALKEIINTQVTRLKTLPFEYGSDIVKYFELLMEESPLKRVYNEMSNTPPGAARNILEMQLRDSIVAGDIDVNIMSKVDKMNVDSNGNILPAEYSDALSALRGFANSNLDSSVIFSAGYNPRLYNYIEQFKEFYPNEIGYLNKKIILKVSDYRSALVQGKIFAKKGLWISEFRIESGLNCGGHAFATEGLLLGPILEEFKNKRAELESELFNLCKAAQVEKNIPIFKQQPELRITAQGGIGTANENSFLLEHYNLDGTGWGSPFLLVPEATNVDSETLQQLATAEQEDYYISDASPLGVRFNNFKKSSAEVQRITRMQKNRPGSPCYKKHLVSNTEFTAEPICTASRQYQDLKLKQLQEKKLASDLYEAEYKRITDKDCLCEGLGTPVLLNNKLPLSHKLNAVTICPGPNLAYFSGTYSLSQMVGHIYGRLNILNTVPRPNLFINELRLYINHFKSSIEKTELTTKQIKSLQTFKENLFESIEYYKNLVPQIKKETDQYLSSMRDDLKAAIDALTTLKIPV